jgi:hypothetical protein
MFLFADFLEANLVCGNSGITNCRNQSLANSRLIPLRASSPLLKLHLKCTVLDIIALQSANNATVRPCLRSKMSMEERRQFLLRPVV